MFEKQLRESRMKCGITQQKMAEHLEVGLRSYQKYEEGTRRPSYELLIRIADFLNVTTDHLLARSTPEEAQETVAAFSDE